MNAFCFVKRHRYAIAIIAAVAVSFVCLNNNYRLYLHSDGPFHLAAIRAVAKSYPPSSPIIAKPSTPDYHYNLSVLFQAGIFRLVEDMHLTILLSGALFLAFVLSAYLWLAQKLVGSKERPEAPVLVLIASLFLWGPTHCMWAGVFSFPGLMVNGIYSQTVGYGFFFAGLASVIRPREGVFRRLIVPSLLLGFSLIQHPMTGSIQAGLVLVWLLVTQKKGTTAVRHFAAMALPALALFLVWPYYPTVEIVYRMLRGAWVLLPAFFLGVLGFVFLRNHLSWETFRQAFARYGFLLRIFFYGVAFHTAITFVRVFLPPIGLARLPLKNPGLVMNNHFFRSASPSLALLLLLPVPLMGVLVGQRGRERTGFHQRIVVAWFIAILCFATVAHMTGMDMYWRLIFFAAVPLFVLLGYKLSSVHTPRGKWMFGLCTLLVLFSNFAYLRYCTQWDQYAPIRNAANLLPENATVLSDPRTSLVMAACAGRKVVSSYVCYWASTLDPEERQRRSQAAATFFSESATNESRRSILREFGVTHIVITPYSYDLDGYSYFYSPLVHRAMRNLAVSETSMGGIHVLAL